MPNALIRDTFNLIKRKQMKNTTLCTSNSSIEKVRRILLQFTSTKNRIYVGLLSVAERQAPTLSRQQINKTNKQIKNKRKKRFCVDSLRKMNKTNKQKSKQAKPFISEDKYLYPINTDSGGAKLHELPTC